MNRVLERMAIRDVYLAATIAGVLTVAIWTGLIGGVPEVSMTTAALIPVYLFLGILSLFGLSLYFSE
jgi:hypothetical protein